MAQWPRMHVGFYLCCVVAVCSSVYLIHIFTCCRIIFCSFLSDHNCLFECFDLFEHFAHK